jgi:hypothetical protein
MHKQQEILMGVIIDASSSMRQSWKNKDGKKIPKIEVVRDSLNEKFRELANLYSDEMRNTHQVDVFCLAMGMVLPMKLVSVDTSNGKELVKNKETTTVRADLVCDLLAMAEILPNKAKLENLRDELNSIWIQYAEEILENIQFNGELKDILQEYIYDNLLESSKKRSERSWRYKLHNWLSNRDSKYTNSILQNLNSYIAYWNKKIEDNSLKESIRYTTSVQRESEEVFSKNKEEYGSYIEKTLSSFADIQVEKILHFIGLGYSVEELMNYFDKKKALELAKNIFSYLDKEVKRNMITNWNQNKLQLFITQKDIGASIDSKYVRSLTEQYIQKHGWEVLRKFAEDKVNNLFMDKFNEHIKIKLPHWIEITSHREVIRSIKDIGNILPEGSSKSMYSEEFMFGTTPIDMAMDRASLRFLDIYHQSKQKILLIITDGDFESDSPIASSELLKKKDIIIIGCYIGKTDVIKRLIAGSYKSWPNGAKLLLEMASEVDKVPSDLQDLLKANESGPYQGKLFYQINHSEDLQKLIQAIIPTKE